MLRDMVRGLAKAVLLAAMAISFPPAAFPQPLQNCAMRSDVLDFLGGQYSERLAAIGVIGERSVLEVHVAESGTWTVVITNVAGISCIVFSGEGWQAIPAPVGKGA
ncbi:MAG: hypothetical protein QHC90_06890 [Shinella sp.]|jgi:hypothetical protein|nr:hypothetical protein [Shinella sp.]